MVGMSGDKMARLAGGYNGGIGKPQVGANAFQSKALGTAPEATARHSGPAQKGPVI